MSDVERLAAGFVEATTEFDYAPLPDHVKSALLDAATVFSRWMDTQGVYRIDPNAPTALPHAARSAG